MQDYVTVMRSAASYADLMLLLYSGAYLLRFVMHMFAGPMNSGAALIAKSFGTNISANVENSALSHKIDHFTYILWILNLKGHQNCIIGSKVRTILLNWCKDYPVLWHYRNCNLTVESPQISTRRPHFMGKIEGR